MGQKQDLNLPDFPAVNHFMNLEGEKFSKSRGIHIDSLDVAEKFGTDYVRFYISSILPEKSDSNWKWGGFQDAINNELINNIGNFIHRTLSFYSDKLDGEFKSSPKSRARIKEETEKTLSEVSTLMKNVEFKQALNEILSFAQFGNQYFSEQKPWESLKGNREEAEKVVYNCLQIIFSLRTMLYPFLPDAMDRLSDQLGFEPIDATKTQDEDLYQFKKVKSGDLNVKEEIEPLFEKIEKEEIEEFRENS
jgi:methionyl-tRNA synthetase